MDGGGGEDGNTALQLHSMLARTMSMKEVGSTWTEGNTNTVWHRCPLGTHS